MSLFENVNCPVCGREFAEGDDIVVCPECGTPHHRDCYNYAGKCVNSGLHKTDFVFNRGGEKPVKKEGTPENGKAPVGTFFTPENVKQGENAPKPDKANQPYMPFGAIPELTNAYDAEGETIEGESIGDVAAAIRSNIPRFVKVFKKFDGTKKKFSWNWCAFFFGSLYYFYRKMYKYAISLIAFSAMLIMGFEYLMLKLAPKTMEIMQEITTLASQNKANEANAKLLELQSASDFGKVTIISYCFFGAFLILRIVEALLADRLYKTTIVSLVKYVRTQLSEGASFTSPMNSVNEANFTQEQMKRYYLSSKGGVSIFAPVAAFLAVDFLLSII